VFAAVFIAYDVLITFCYPRIDQKLGTFPFSAFPMFSVVKAKKPYGVHQTYETLGGRIEVLSDRPIDPKLRAWLDRNGAYRTMWMQRDPKALSVRLGVLLAELKARAPDAGVHGVRVDLTVYRAPAVPEPARFDRIPVAVLGQLDDTRGFRSGLGKLGKDADGAYVELPEGLAADAEPVQLVAFVDAQPTPQPLVATRRGRRLYHTASPKAHTILAVVVAGVTHVVAEIPAERAARAKAGLSAAAAASDL
jgi:hypothetical protein